MKVVKNQKQGLDFWEGLSFILLSLLITPFGSLAIFLLLFRKKDKQKWETTKKLFWSLVGSSLLILLAFLVYWIAQVVYYVLELSEIGSSIGTIVMSVAALISFALLLSPLALLWYIWGRKK